MQTPVFFSPSSAVPIESLPPSMYEGRINAFSVESPTPYIVQRLAWKEDDWLESLMIWSTCPMKIHTLTCFDLGHWVPMHQPISSCLFSKYVSTYSSPKKLHPYTDSFPKDGAYNVNINIFLVARQATLCKAVLSMPMALMGWWEVYLLGR